MTLLLNFFAEMDPSFYSPQQTSKAVCYCRVHGTLTQGHYLAEPSASQPPVSPVTRQLMQQHPEALVIQSGKVVPCHVVYHHHQPVFGYMAHNTLDGATAIARQRRQQKKPDCCKKKSQKSPKNANFHKSAPSSPVGTPKKLVNRKKTPDLNLDPQWITAFPTLETPSESGFPIKTTGCCGRKKGTISTRRPRSNSYSALDSNSDDGISLDDPKTPSKKPVRFFFNFQ